MLKNKTNTKTKTTINNSIAARRLRPLRPRRGLWAALLTSGERPAGADGATAAAAMAPKSADLAGLQSCQEIKIII